MPKAKPLHDSQNLPQIAIAVEYGDWPDETILSKLVEKSVRAASRTAGLSWPVHAELSLLFTNDAEMAQINAQWRDKPVPTNVLSFPGGDVEVGEPADHMIGDLVFALETLRREAGEQNKTFENHLCHLVIHGFLHLFGYDHMEGSEAEKMEGLEINALSSLGIANPYA